MHRLHLPGMPCMATKPVICPEAPTSCHNVFVCVHHEDNQIVLHIYNQVYCSIPACVMSCTDGLCQRALWYCIHPPCTNLFIIKVSSSTHRTHIWHCSKAAPMHRPAAMPCKILAYLLTCSSTYSTVTKMLRNSIQHGYIAPAATTVNACLVTKNSYFYLRCNIQLLPYALFMT